MPNLRSIKTRNVKKSLVTTGLVLSAAPLLLMTGWTDRQFTALRENLRHDSEHIASASLNQQTALLARIVDLAQHGVLDDLRLAQGTSLGYGGVVQSRNRHVQWQATNQFTNQISSYKLPLVLLGRKPIRTSASPQIRARLVDDVHDLAGVGCTLFERMNPQGDMLAILTSVVAPTGKRAIGTFLPASLPGGQANPVIQTILTGKVYSGSARSANQNSIAAYAPLVSSNDEVIGMLSVSLPESEVAANFQQTLSGTNLGPGAEIFALSAAPENAGRVIFSTLPSATNRMQAEMIKAAMAHPAAPVTAKYDVTRGNAPPLRMMAHLEYLPQWNWVLGVAVPESRAQQFGGSVAATASGTKNVLFAILAVSMLVSWFVWFRWGHKLSGAIAKLGQDLRHTLTTLQQFAQGVRSASERQRLTFAQGKSTLANTARTAAELRKISEQNAAFLDAALKGPLAANGHSNGALDELQVLETSFTEMRASNTKIRSLMQSIDDIAFQSRILALNASIEAARAGAAGASFAVVADEFGKLANRCTEAAGNTTGLLGEAVQRTARDSAALKDLGTAIRQISGGRQQILPLIEQIHDGTQQEIALVTQISASLENVSRAVDQTQTISERVAKAAEQVQVQANVQGRADNATAPVSQVRIKSKARRRPTKSRPTSAAIAPANIQPVHPAC